MEDHSSGSQSDALIEQYIDSLHRAYLQLRQRIKPDMTCVHGHDLEWRQLAVMLVKHKIDPYDYIQFCYDMFIPRHDDLYPGVVLSLTNVHRFKGADAERGEGQLRMLLRLQFLELEHQLSRGRKLEDILVDEGVSLSAVFRYAICKAFGLLKLTPLFEEDANLMLTFKPAYKALLHDLLEGNHDTRGESRNKVSIGFTLSPPPS